MQRWNYCARSVYNTSTGARITMREHPAIVRSRVKIVQESPGIAVLEYVLVVSAISFSIGVRRRRDVGTITHQYDGTRVAGGTKCWMK